MNAGPDSDDDGSDEQCRVCGESKMPGWDVCPACGHPYDTA